MKLLIYLVPVNLNILSKSSLNVHKRLKKSCSSTYAGLHRKYFMMVSSRTNR